MQQINIGSSGKKFVGSSNKKNNISIGSPDKIRYQYHRRESAI